MKRQFCLTLKNWKSQVLVQEVEWDGKKKWQFEIVFGSED